MRTQAIYYMNVGDKCIRYTKNIFNINYDLNSYNMKKFLKRLLKAYFEGVNEMYGPAIRAGINPFI